jgi:thioesterase domain-containing protein
MRVADLTTLEEKLAEVTGLAGAAQETTRKVESMLDGGPLAEALRQMRSEAEETESRCIELADQREGKKTAILEKAQETKNEASEMMRTYLGEDSDKLDGFEFLVMAEAGEVGHWAILGKLNETAGEDGVRELVEWALPIQERHLTTVRAGSLELAAEEDPSST